MKIPSADDTRKVLPVPSKTGCQCRNHRGGSKQQHKTRQAAELAALRQMKHTGRAEVYKCPSSDRWHVTTRRAA